MKELFIDINILIIDNHFKEFLEKSDPDEFTFYDVIDMAQYEIRHSNTLAWLFDARAVHNLKSLFLTRFIESVYNYKNNKEKMEDTIRIDDKGIFLVKSKGYIDFNKTKFEIRREWKHIDILIVSKEIKFVIVIENKPGMEDPGQLSSYKDNVIDKNDDEEGGFPDDIYTRLFVFLTIDGTPPEKNEDKKHWLPYDYKKIVEIIEQDILSERSAAVINNPRIADFLRQYVYNIKKNLIKYYDLTNDASIIYQHHKKMFEEIIDIKSRNQLNELFDEYHLDKKTRDAINYIILSQSELEFKILKHFDGKLKDQKVFILHHPRKNEKWLCFVPSELRKITEKKGHHKNSLFFALEPRAVSLEFYADASFAKDVFRVIDSFDKFTIYRKDYYSNRIYQKNILTEDDYYNKSFDEIVRMYDEALSEFLKVDANDIYVELDKMIDKR